MISQSEKLFKLKKALERGLMDFVDTIIQCQEGKMQFWEVEEAVAVTSISQSGKFRVMSVHAVGGTLQGCKELFTMLEGKAREWDCTHCVAQGRLGFDKHFRDLVPGGKRIATHYQLEL